MRKKKKYGGVGPGDHRPIGDKKINQNSDNIFELNVRMDTSDGMIDRLIDENKAIGQIIDNNYNKINNMLGPALAALLERVKTLEEALNREIPPMSDDIQNMYVGGKRRRKTRKTHFHK